MWSFRAVHFGRKNAIWNSFLFTWAGFRASLWHPKRRTCFLRAIFLFKLHLLISLCNVHHEPSNQSEVCCLGFLFLFSSTNCCYNVVIRCFRKKVHGWQGGFVVQIERIKKIPKSRFVSRSPVSWSWNEQFACTILAWTIRDRYFLF